VARTGSRRCDAAQHRRRGRRRATAAGHQRRAGGGRPRSRRRRPHCCWRCNPQTRFLLSDDGLQHYALARTLEIVVLDGARGVGNGHLLPGGPLREPVSRLAAADALVINGESRTGLRLPAAVPQFQQRLQAGAFVHAGGQLPPRTAADFAGQRVVAVAGIGHPERFFRTLRELGVELAATHAFPDHHRFVAADLPQDADAVIVTAKDAVKLQCINHARLWVLVSARLEPDLSRGFCPNWN
jgi:tetraacyldisaccharide 4'-kinase